MKYANQLLQGRKLETLVENQTSHHLKHATMHIFETHQQAENVFLQMDRPILASMLTGKKIMYLRDHHAFDFLPGESLILPAHEIMRIDFPEAQMQNPTRCLAMGICPQKINEIVMVMNESMKKADDREWEILDYNFRFTNDIAIYQIIQRLLFLFGENHPSRDLFVDLMLRELIIRVLQSESRKIYAAKALQMSSNNRIAFVIDYIRKNLDKPITVEELSKKAHMSESNFHRVFKNELGISPIDFINSERIKLATSMLHNPKNTIKEVYLACGFNSPSYFNRVFKQKKNISPKEFQLKAIGEG